MKAISFYAPHWELVFDGRLALGEYGVKTRNDDSFHYRGPVLCYTSLKDHSGPVRAYGYKDIPRGVVGCAMLVDLKRLTNQDKINLCMGYNKVSKNQIPACGDDPEFIQNNLFML